MKLKSFLMNFIVFLSPFILVGCLGGGGSENNSNDSNSENKEETSSRTMEGQVLDGKIEGAQVSVYNKNGDLLSESKTDGKGNFRIDINDSVSNTVVAKGGTVNGTKYNGELRAICKEVDKKCVITPWSTVLKVLVEDFGFNYEDANVFLSQKTGIENDPFLRNKNSELFYRNSESGFSTKEASREINKGNDLNEWVGVFSDWLASDENKPAPAGIPGSIFNKKGRLLYSGKMFNEHIEERFTKSDFETESNYIKRVTEMFDESQTFIVKTDDPNAFSESYDAENEELTITLRQNGCRSGSVDPCFPQNAIQLETTERSSSASLKSSSQSDSVIFLQAQVQAIGEKIVFDVSPEVAEDKDKKYQLAFRISFRSTDVYDSDTFLDHLIGNEKRTTRSSSGWNYSYRYKGPRADLEKIYLVNEETNSLISETNPNFE